MEHAVTEPEACSGLPLNIYSEGFFTSFRPVSRISNTPISLVEPNLFFTPRSILYEACLSPSKYSTVSTICSSTLGPATTPSFVTCPTIKIDIARPFASCINVFVDSLTWLTLPGAELTSSLYMVWMESMITISGFCCRMTSSMTSRFVSHNRATSSPNSPILVARSLICFRDSSPDMYRTFCFLTERFRHTCRSSVDFPIPGSPPTRIKEPGIIPPPSTRSSSSMPVVVRSSLLIEISFNLAGVVTAWDFRTAAPPFFTAGSSVNVFHSRQPGHCPSHFGDS